MSVDQTSFFQQCVDIYEESMPEEQKQGRLVSPTGEDKDRVKDKDDDDNKSLKEDSFFQKSTAIYNTLISINTLIDTIRPQYLMANSREMSEDEKLIIGTEIKLKIQQISNTIRNLQAIESEISKHEIGSLELSHGLQKIGFKIREYGSTKNSTFEFISRNLISMGDYSDYLSIRNETTLTIFQNIIKSLSIMLNKTLIKWNEIHDKRIERLEQLKKSTLSTSLEYNKYDVRDEVKQQIVSDEYEKLETELPQQELIQLENEQDNLMIELKKGTIETVSKIETTMIDISGMINEIGIQLSIQNENISILDNFKDDIVHNVKSGNTVLVKANEKNSKFNKSFAWFIFLAGLILLIVDYIL